MASFSGKKASRRMQKKDAELDITSFMNLMIVLVPVLLMMMVFSRITVVELTLPQLASMASPQEMEQQLLEVEVSERGLDVFYPQGYLVANIPMIEATNALTKSNSQASAANTATLPNKNNTNNTNKMVHNYSQLQKTLISVKQTLLAKGADKKDIILLLQENTSYQTIVSLIDTTRSYEAVVAASVVQAELFPQVSLSDAPVRNVLRGDSSASYSSNSALLTSISTTSIPTTSHSPTSITPGRLSSTRLSSTRMGVQP